MNSLRSDAPLLDQIKGHLHRAFVGFDPGDDLQGVLGNAHGLLFEAFIELMRQPAPVRGLSPLRRIEIRVEPTLVDEVIREAIDRGDAMPPAHLEAQRDLLCALAEAFGIEPDPSLSGCGLSIEFVRRRLEELTKARELNGVALDIANLLGCPVDKVYAAVVELSERGAAGKVPSGATLTDSPALGNPQPILVNRQSWSLIAGFAGAKDAPSSTVEQVLHAVQKLRFDFDEWREAWRTHNGLLIQVLDQTGGHEANETLVPQAIERISVLNDRLKTSEGRLESARKVVVDALNACDLYDAFADAETDFEQIARRYKALFASEKEARRERGEVTAQLNALQISRNDEIDALRRRLDSLGGLERLQSLAQERNDAIDAKNRAEDRWASLAEPLRNVLGCSDEQIEAKVRELIGAVEAARQERDQYAALERSAAEALTTQQSTIQALQARIAELEHGGAAETGSARKREPAEPSSPDSNTSRIANEARAFARKYELYPSPWSASYSPRIAVEMLRDLVGGMTVAAVSAKSREADPGMSEKKVRTFENGVSTVVQAAKRLRGVEREEIIDRFGRYCQWRLTLPGAKTGFTADIPEDEGRGE